jgi:WD40 repeat protein
LLGLGDEQEASITYREAENSATEAIARVQKIDQLVHAYKIKLALEYMRILISCKSLALEEKKLSKIGSVCITACDSLNELHANPKIISAIEIQIDPPLLGKKIERELLLSELWALDYLILSIAKKCNPSTLSNILRKLIISAKSTQIHPLRCMELSKQSCLLQTLNGHSDSVWSVCTSGDKIISGSDEKTLRVWDMNPGKCLCTLNGHTEIISSVCISGDKIISGSWDKTLRIWDINTGQCLNILTGHTDRVRSVCTLIEAKGENKMISCGDDKTIRVWDLNTLECLRILTGHTSSVCSSGTRIISGSMDKTLRVWDIKTAQCISIIAGHSASVWSVNVSGDQRIR